MGGKNKKNKNKNQQKTNDVQPSSSRNDNLDQNSTPVDGGQQSSVPFRPAPGSNDGDEQLSGGQDQQVTVNTAPGEPDTSDSDQRQNVELPITETNPNPFPPVSEPKLELEAASSAKNSPQDPKGYAMVERPDDFLGREDRIVGGYAARPGFANSKSFTVWTNYLSLDLTEDQNIYVYEVNGIDNTWTRPKKRVLMERFIHACPLFKEDRSNFSSDYNQKIIAFEDLSGGQLEPGSQQALAEVSVANHNAKDQSSGTSTLQLMYKHKFSFNEMNAFCWGYGVDERQSSDRLSPVPRGDLVAAINLLISDAIKLKSPKPVLLMGTNKVYAKEGHEDLGVDHKLAIRGYWFGIQAGMGWPLLNVNPITTVFHEPMTVDQYVLDRNGRVSDELKDHLKGVRVWLTMERMNVQQDHQDDLDQPSRRLKTIADFGSVASKQRAYERYSVWDHVEYMGYQTQGHNNSLCVNLGSKELGKEQWFLAEDLVILPYQPFRGDSTSLTSAIIKKACKKPKQNRDLILREFLPFLGMDNAKDDPCELIEQGLNIFPQLQEVHAHNAARTSIRYHDKELTIPSFGQWILLDQTFLSVDRKFEGRAFFLIPSSLQLTREQRELYLKFFHEQYSVNGVTGLGFFDGFNKSNCAPTGSFNVQDLTRQLKKAKEDGADLAVLILPRKNKAQLRNYATFKSIVDQLVGMKSLCMSEDKVMKTFPQGRSRERPSTGFQIPDSVGMSSAFAGYVRNIGMKLNVRLGNENHTAEEAVLEAQIPDFATDKHVMILGADVVHKGNASHEDTPSIAAVVGTIDKNFAKYRGSARRNPVKQEIIETPDMKAMVIERLQAYRKVNDCLPSRILYYRDGVDEGQWTLVREQEVTAIRQAWDELNNGETKTEIKITTVIVWKRHSTRFYPKQNGKNNHEIPHNGNCVPGTVVDSGVCMPYHWDFFLISHNAIQGTAKPVHYIVLQDEMGFKPAQIQNLTNVLCSTYARSTTAVSYVPAAYYADHLCERVKQYLRPLFDNEDLRGKSVEQACDEMWERGDRPKGNPWREELDDTMFWV